MTSASTLRTQKKKGKENPTLTEERKQRYTDTNETEKQQKH